LFPMQDQYFNAEGIIYYLLTYSTPFSYRGSIASLGFELGSIIKNIILDFILFYWPVTWIQFFIIYVEKVFLYSYDCDYKP